VHDLSRAGSANTSLVA